MVEKHGWNCSHGSFTLKVSENVLSRGFWHGSVGVYETTKYFCPAQQTPLHNLLDDFLNWRIPQSINSWLPRGRRGMLQTSVRSYIIVHWCTTSPFCPLVAGFPKSVRLVRHVWRILKMSDDKPLDRQTECPAVVKWPNVWRENDRRRKSCSPVIFSVKWWVSWENRPVQGPKQACTYPIMVEMLSGISNRGVISWKMLGFLIILVPNIWQYFK